MRKKALSLALALATCLGLMAVPASAASATIKEIVSAETYQGFYDGISWNVPEFNDGIAWLGYRVIGGGYIGSYGAIDTNGNIVIEPDTYSAVGSFSDGVAWTRANDKWYAVDTNGNELFSLDAKEVHVDLATGFHNGLARVESLPERQVGFVDKSGKMVVPFDQKNKVPSSFYDGLSVAYDPANAYYGYMDKTGKMVIPYQFADAKDFDNGAAPVKLGNRWTVIDKTGKELLPQEYNYDRILSSELILAKGTDGYAFFNRAGQLVSGGYSEISGGYSDGMTGVVKDGKLGFVNERGELAVPCQFYARNNSLNFIQFRDGFSMVRTDGNNPTLNIIDKSGRVTGTADRLIGHAGNGCFTIESRESGRARYGLKDYTGKEIVPCKYAAIGDFSGGVAPVKNFENKLGFVNTDGTEIVPCQFSEIRYSNEPGIFLVKGEKGFSIWKASGWTAPATPSTPTEPTTPTTPSGTATANPTNDKLTSDGVLQNPTVYKIGDSNYFKIRDLAAILNGTEKQFSVGYDNEKKSVTATTGQGYTKLDGDLAGPPAGQETAEASSDAIYVNGQKVEAEVYKIGGNNYFKLRDLGKALNFYVGWSQEQGMFIETDKPYSE